MSKTRIYPIIDLHTCIQGEGKYAGIPHVLIRLSGCNLRCQYKENICDSPYSSWFPENGKYTMNDINKLYELNPQINHTLITGGEPFLHQKMILMLTKLAKTYNHFVAAETNGTIYANLLLDFITISPKLSSSIPVTGTIIQNPDGSNHIISEKEKEKHEKQYINLNTLQKLTQKYEYVFKFVIQDDCDIDKTIDLVHKLEIPENKIYLMPEGISNNQLQKKRVWLMEKCIELGYNYTDRLHIITYGNKRGT